MGKKCKRKVQWRRLSLNELRSKTSDDECDDEEDKDKLSSSASPPPSSPDSRPRSTVPRRPFHPNFHSGDQRRYHPHFDHRDPAFERGPSLERNPYQKFYGRPPFPHDRPPFLGQRRRPFKFFGRGGFYVRGPSPSWGERGPTRRWSENDGLVLDDMAGEEEENLDIEDRPSQPVHTVFIGNEEYTKIQTPRQEVIFKKSSLDKKRDSVDLGSAPSTCGSINGCEPNSQGDQASLAGSIDDAGEEPSQENGQENGSYEDTNGLFVGEPGKPPLAGVVMQQAFPGGPMISIPVHWTHFLDPGLIPGDTALTPLDPAFTHVIDPKDLPVDPAHILPVQHDSNGCPVTVQVKLNAEGQPFEIEPSAFTVSLSTLEPHQQEVLLHKSADLLSCTQSRSAERLIGENLEDKEKSSGSKTVDERSKDVNEESQRRSQEQGEYFSTDSQYATMSEASTAPTTPSGELCDPTETTDCSKPRHGDSAVKDKRMSRSDSLLDSESYEPDGSEESSCSISINSLGKKNENCVCECSTAQECDDRVSIESSDASELPSVVIESVLPQSSSNLPVHLDCEDRLPKVPNSDVSEEKVLLSSKKEGSKRSRKKKSRSVSIDSTLSSQNSLADISQDKKMDAEPLSKYQVKKSARKLKKEKRSSREKSKPKTNISIKSCAQKSRVESERKNSEVGPNETSSDIQQVSETLDTSEYSSSETERVETLSESKSSTINKSEEEEKLISESQSVTRGENETEETLLSESQSSEIGENLLSDSQTSKIEKNEAKETLLCESQSSTIEENITIKDNNDSEKDYKELNCEIERELGQKNDEVPIEEHMESENGEKQTETLEKEEEKEDSSAPSFTRKEDEGFTCIPGFVMVPILTPYYDPAVLYSYPMIIPETPPERNYGRKKKKKYKKRYHDEEVFLDTELYAGEPFVATPNGYVMPVDASHMCQIHGYPYPQNMFSPHIVPNEGLVSVEHLTYVPDYMPDPPLYYKVNGVEEIEMANRRVPNLYEEEKVKSVEEISKESSEKEEIVLKDQNESCDSGVSESEELVQLTPTEGANGGLESEVTTSVIAEEKDAKSGNKIDKKRVQELVKTQDSKKETKKKKNHSKKKKQIVVEIEEPDFASFSSPTPQFEVPKEDDKKLDANRKSKNKRKKKGSQGEHSRNESQTISLKDPDIQTNKKEAKNIETQDSPRLEKSKASQAKSKTKKESQNSESTKKTNKTKNKKSPQKKTSTCKLTENPTEEASKFDDEFSSIASECLVENTFIDDLSEKEEMHSEVDDSATREDECLSGFHSTIVLSQESGIGGESEESMTYSENFESFTIKDHEELNLDQESMIHFDYISKQLEQEQNDSSTSEESDHKLDQEATCNANCLSNIETLSETLVLHDTEKDQCTSENADKLQNGSILEFKGTDDLSSEEDSSETQDSIVQTNSSSTLFQSEAVSSDSPTDVPFFTTSTENVENVLPASTEIESASLLLEETPSSSFKDLGVTEAVRRWIRDVTPEKAFAITEETRHLFFPSCDSDYENFLESEEEPDEMGSQNDQSKNGLRSPLAVSPSKMTLDANSDRVAIRSSSSPRTPKKAAISQRLRRHTTSSQVMSDVDGESVDLDHCRLYSCSSTSSFPLSLTLEDSTLIDDPRVYDPSVYSKYYKLSADIQIMSSNSSTRESTLSPSLVESEEVDLFSVGEIPKPTEDGYSISIATELLKSEKIRANMSHISPSLCDNTLPLPLCGSTAYIENQSDNGCVSEGGPVSPGNSCSVSSSGIGSSLASTPNLTPAHQLSSTNTGTDGSTSRPKLEPHPLVNLSVGDGPLPCRTMCCSVM